MINKSGILKKYGKISKYEIIGNVSIIYTENGIYCLKKQKRMDIKQIHSYIKSKNYINILDLDVIDKVEITPFVEDFKTPLEDRLSTLLYLVSLLHTKTTFYKKISIDEIKEIYESKTEKILYTKEYYESLCYKKDLDNMLSPSDYLFIRNISILLLSLNRSKFFLDKWYDTVKGKTSKRCVLNHNNLDTSHIIINKIPYLINFNDCIFESPIIDLENLIRNNYKNIDINVFFNSYMSRYSLNKEEIYLFYSNLLMPFTLKDEKLEIEKCKNMYEFYNYLDTVNKFISENNSIKNK